MHTSHPPPHPRPALSGQRQEDHCSFLFLAPGSEKTLPTPPTPIRKKRTYRENWIPCSGLQVYPLPTGADTTTDPQICAPLTCPPASLHHSATAKRCQITSKIQIHVFALFFPLLFLGVFYFVLFWDRVSLCGPDCPRTTSVIHTDLELRAILLPLTL